MPIPEITMDPSETTNLLPDVVATTPRRLDQNSLLDISPIVHETDDSITIRRPVQYESLNNGGQQPNLGVQSRATVNRYKYYSKLASHSNSSMLMPNHIVPFEYFLILPIRLSSQSQNSIITIFSIWNTMVGTALLSMPWAFERTGFGCGIVILLLMAFLTLYTGYRVLKSPSSMGGLNEMSIDVEFSDVCRFFLGRFGDYVSVAFSALTILGATVVYWVLMSNFLYHTVKFVYDDVNGILNDTKVIGYNNKTYDVICPNREVNNTQHLSVHPSADHSWFESTWSQTTVAPFILLPVLYPLVSLKSATFFTKFNALGTVSVIYICGFIAYKSYNWGINMNFDTATMTSSIPELKWTFPTLTGILSLAFFIHNCILSIMKNQKHPQNNARDLSIAYFCVASTYMFIAVLFYICFPLDKECIEDNLLNNFISGDLLAFVGRLFLLFQMITVFPLLMYIFRIQLLGALFGCIYPSWLHVFILNSLVISICLIFAVFLPQIGVIIRFSGAMCGMVYVFTLPSLVHMLSLKRRGALTWFSIFAHSLIILFGVCNFIAQFLIP